eukprot:gene7047-8195_t
MLLKLELVPGKSLGDFVLEIIFNDADPLSIDIVLKLVDDGVLLRFAPSSQRLRVIEIFDVSKLMLSYRGSIFSSSENVASFVNIYSKFGPSYPGDFNAKKSVYHLHYPGLSFSFPISPKFNSLYSEGTELPVELPDGSTPIVSKIFVYSGLQMKTPLSVVPSHTEEIIVFPNKGVYFTKRNCILSFISTPQDVLSELGPPSKIYHKEEDNMKIHTHQVESTPSPDYFYNYFHLGIDILFDVKRNMIKKFIFHTNFPTHYEFNLYSKSSFKILQDVENSKTIFDTIKALVEGKIGAKTNNAIDPNDYERDEKYGQYDVDQMRVKLGQGRECFERAVEALKSWKPFSLDWVDFCFNDVPIAAGNTVGILSKQFGFWMLSFCRIVYVIDGPEEDENIIRYGFAYGTLSDHLEKGEERFVIEWRRDQNGGEGEVFYEILSFSEPQHWMTQLGYPIARFFQNKFGVDSVNAMLKATGSTTQAIKHV